MESSWGVKVGRDQGVCVGVAVFSAKLCWRPCMAEQSWLAQLVAAGKVSSDADNNFPWRWSSALYTNTAVEQSMPAFRVAHVPSRTIGTTSVQWTELSCGFRETSVDGGNVWPCHSLLDGKQWLARGRYPGVESAREIEPIQAGYHDP